MFGRFQHVFNHPETLSYYNKMTHFDMVTSLPALLQVEDRVSMAVVARVAGAAARPSHRGAGGEHAAGDEVPRRRDEVHPEDAPSSTPAADAASWSGRTRWASRCRCTSGRAGAAATSSDDILLSQRCRERGIYSTATRSRSLLGNEAAFGRRLWGLLNLELWHRQFIDAD